MSTSIQLLFERDVAVISAIIIIQAFARMAIARARYKKTLLRSRAALIIQTVFRRRSAIKRRIFLQKLRQIVASCTSKTVSIISQENVNK